MNQFEISLKKLNALALTPSTESNVRLAASFNAALMHQGFTMSKDLFNVVKTLNKDQITHVYNETLATIKHMIGSNVEYVPMYPNFPKQVMDASLVELYVNAILHYWTFGTWKPEYEKLPREFYLENDNLKQISLASQQEFNEIFTQIVCSNNSISDADKRIVEWFISHRDEATSVPTDIPFKENMCVVAGMLLKQKKDISGLVKTATDVLRIITYMSGGDVSLAENTKFKSLPRHQRKMFCQALERVVSEEDIARHRNKWCKVFHNLHVGEYSDRLYKIANKVRNNKPIRTFNGQVEQALEQKQFLEVVKLLVQRPGEFARRIDHVLRTTNHKNFTIEKFLSVANKVDTRVLLQLLGHLKVRNKDIDQRVVFPKGSVQKATILESHIPKLSKQVTNKLKAGIEGELLSRFKAKESLGCVWIDPLLEDCPLPSQQRSASESLFTVARGTRLPIGDKNTLRFFIYWIGRDIDLSASLHREDFSMLEHISYTNLRSNTYDSCHSGDITYAPDGASEFIDITIDEAVKHGARYVVMNVYVFAGPNLADHEKCYAGWMTRSRPQSNEVYDPKTVQQKSDLTAESKNAIPVVFDLVERKAIWTDLSTKGRTHRWGNNIHSNENTTRLSLETIVNAINHKVTLHELFTLHAKARGELVESREEADIVYSLFDGDVTPFDINTIDSEYTA